PRRPSADGFPASSWSSLPPRPPPPYGLPGLSGQGAEDDHDTARACTDLPTGHELPSRSTGMVAAPGRLARPLARRAPACRPGVGGDPNRRPRGVAPLAARALAVPPRAAPGDARLSRLSVGR